MIPKNQPYPQGAYSGFLNWKAGRRERLPDNIYYMKTPDICDSSSIMDNEGLTNAGESVKTLSGKVYFVRCISSLELMFLMCMTMTYKGC